MCGIAGFWDLTRSTSDHQLHATTTDMIDQIRHRGPDAGAVWTDASSGVALGHRRLSILDLSPTGAQPMHSRDGRYVISFNGEIYNFTALRRTLESMGHAFRGHSDTEVMLAAFCEWGVKETLQRSNGMFAFALWDRVEHCLYLARDRMGEKPLYYGLVGNTVVFASELKAIRKYPGFHGEIDRDAVAQFLRFNYVPSPGSIYHGVYKLPPGTFLTIHANTVGTLPEPTPYWSVTCAAEQGGRGLLTCSDDEAVEELQRLLLDSVKLRMVADVPLGAFLSGGIDSSTVVAMMQALSPQPVKTFTIGFNEAAYSETKEAEAVARHLGTDHETLYIEPSTALDVIPLLPSMYDEPFSDPSQIPTYLVSRLARQHVTVALSGDGGDELFAGYNRHSWVEQVHRRTRAIPRLARHLASEAMSGLSPRAWDVLYNLISARLPGRFKQRNFGDKVHKLAQILPLSTPHEIYTALVSHWKQPHELVLGCSKPSGVVQSLVADFTPRDTLSRMLYLDQVSYLPDDILVKLDRASMGASLEGRIPFLDHRLVEFSWRVPKSQKIRDGQSKWLLRQVLYKYLPQDMVERPKMGFSVPLDSWLRGPLREWADDLLDESRLRSEGFLNPTLIQKKWRQHLRGSHNWQYHLWDVLMFQAWLHSNQK